MWYRSYWCETDTFCTGPDSGFYWTDSGRGPWGVLFALSLPALWMPLLLGETKKTYISEENWYA